MRLLVVALAQTSTLSCTHPRCSPQCTTATSKCPAHYGRDMERDLDDKHSLAAALVVLCETLVSRARCGLMYLAHILVEVHGALPICPPNVSVHGTAPRCHAESNCDVMLSGPGPTVKTYRRQFLQTHLSRHVRLKLHQPLGLQLHNSTLNAP